MLKKITNNLGWKIVSVLLAFALWLFVMDYEDPSITKSFNGVEVHKVNMDSEAFKDKYIEIKEGQKVDLVVKGRKSIVDNLTARNINAYADFEKISFTGAVDIEVELSDFAKEVDIISKSPTDMLLEYEDIISQQKRVQYYFEGELPEGYVALEPVFSPSYIQITGPKSEVQSVSSILVAIPVEQEKTDITLFAKPKILDSNKKEINTVEISTDDIYVTVPVEKVKTVPLVFDKVGEVDQNYRLTETTLSHNTIDLVADPGIVDLIKEVRINTISLNGLTDSTQKTVSIEELLPDNVDIASEYKEITVALTIKPVIEKVIEIKQSDITVKYLPAEYQFSYIGEGVVEVRLKGLEKDLEIVDIDYLSPYIRLYNLDAGEHNVQLYYTIPHNVIDETEASVVTVELKIVDEEVTGNIAENAEANEETNVEENPVTTVQEGVEETPEIEVEQ